MIPIFQLVKASPEATALLGDNPVKFFEFGEAPQDVSTPYATWQQVTGNPENLLADRPTVDFITVQVDVWTDTAQQARAIASAIRYAIELDSHITSIRGETKEAGIYRSSFDSQFIVNR